MIFSRRTRRFGAVALGATILGGASATTLAANSAGAAGIISAVTTVSCSVTGAHWCISGNNTSSGIGVSGTSKTGTGLRGTSTSQYGLQATSVSNSAILAQTTTGSAAISATATAGNGYGVSGTSTTGAAGVVGFSPASIGVYGNTTSTTSPVSKGVYGVSYDGYGVLGSAPGAEGYGVEGDGGELGVYGSSETGTGVSADSKSATHPALLAVNADGGDGIDVTTQAQPCATFTGCAPITATGVYNAFRGVTGNNGLPLELINSDASRVIFYIDSNGNVSYDGSLNNFARHPDGTVVRSFTATTSMPIVEDFGTAQLAAGAVAVALDPTFASSIDARVGYRVFLTPDGDTHGLYVASKTPSGFVVREAGGGHATVPFDYRIVATKLGESGQRMAVINPASLPRVKLPSAPGPFKSR